MKDGNRSKHCPPPVSPGRLWTPRPDGVCRRGWPLLAMLVAAGAMAQSDLRDSDAAYEGFRAAQQRLYEDTGSRYTAARTEAPDEVAIAIAHCEFVRRFAESEDIGWIERASADSEDCGQGLRERWPDDPEVRLYFLEREYGDEALATAVELWQGSADWPEGLRGRLAATLSWAYKAPSAATRPEKWRWSRPGWDSRS